MIKQPVIGIVPLVDTERDSYWILPGYVNSILQANGLPLTLPLTTDAEQIAQLCHICDGFLFTGGQDVMPSLYGADRHPSCGSCCPERDAMESLLLQAALQRDIPVLGICRGVQLMNVVLGGTLYQDLSQQYPSSLEHHQSPPYDKPVHTVTILLDTPLYQLLQKEQLPVNSYHHQGIWKLAPPLRCMAIAEDGLIEGVYLPEKPFVWGVQWHPEFSYQIDGYSQRIIQAFVDAAKSVSCERIFHTS